MTRSVVLVHATGLRLCRGTPYRAVPVRVLPAARVYLHVDRGRAPGRMSLDPRHA